MRIVFDLDNTIVDELGATVRKDLVSLIKELKAEHELIIWSNSTKNRAIEILKFHRLYSYFDEFIFREDYDPDDSGVLKNVKSIGADFFIDDDPNEVTYNKKNGSSCFLISSYRKGMKVNSCEIDQIRKAIIIRKWIVKIKSIFLRGPKILINHRSTGDFTTK